MLLTLGVATRNDVTFSTQPELALAHHSQQGRLHPKTHGSRVNRFSEVGDERHERYFLSELDLSLLGDLTTRLVEPVLNFKVCGDFGLVSLDPLPDSEDEGIPFLTANHRLHRALDLSDLRGRNSFARDLVGCDPIQPEDWEQVTSTLVAPVSTHAAAAKSLTSRTVPSGRTRSGPPTLLSVATGQPSLGAWMGVQLSDSKDV